MYVCMSILPEQFIGQPPVTPFDVTVAFMPHFIETTAGFRISQSAFANISWKIVHTCRTDTRDFAGFSKDVDFFLWICGRFYNHADFMCHFTRVIRDTVFHIHCVRACVRACVIYIYGYKNSLKSINR